MIVVAAGILIAVSVVATVGIIVRVDIVVTASNVVTGLIVYTIVIVETSTVNLLYNKLYFCNMYACTAQLLCKLVPLLGQILKYISDQAPSNSTRYNSS